MTRTERRIGRAMVALAMATLIVQGALNVAANARDLGVAGAFHVLANAEVPIVSGAQSAVLFFPATVAAVAVFFVLRLLGTHILFDAMVQIAFVIAAGAQVWVIYLLLLRAVRRRVKP